jgi:hypothetical protein
MKKQFLGSEFGPLGYVALFMAFAIAPLVMGKYLVAAFLVLVSCIFVAQFVYNFQVYVITDDEFYVANLLGTKFDSMLFTDMVRIYSSKGIQTVRTIKAYDSYEVGILKIQMKDGDIFKLNLDDVWNYIPLLEALHEKVGERMFDPEGVAL